jgi:hypothetical protein
MMYLDLFTLVSVNLLLWLLVWLFPTRIVKLSRLHISGAQGLALPGFIFLTASAFNERSLRHEFMHIRQMRRYSPLGVALFLGIGYLYLFVKYFIKNEKIPRFRDIYLQHPFEREAFGAMDDTNDLGPFLGDLPTINGY